MSAESPRHARSGGPLIVPPQPPSDRTIIDTVSGFINDVKLTSTGPDTKDTIQWARFETADVNEPTPEGDNNEISPLLLILGYGSGVQVWLIPPSGEAQEVLSWRQGTVRVLRILPTPQSGDSFASRRPLIALCDSASPGPTFCSLSFISIRGGEQVKSIKFKNPILDVLANKRSVVVSFSERFAVFDAGTLEDRMAVTTCYPCPCPLGGSAPVNPLALGDRWLAYADKKINPAKRSSGGCEGEGVASYTATVLHAAKSLGKGLRGLGESVAQSLGGARGASPPRLDQHQPGVLTVIDIEGNNEDDSQDGGEPYDPIVAHFIAHSDAIIALAFDSSGMLLITADRRGHDFHVFRVNPHPCGSARAAVHHLYTLHRGDTTAKVQDIAISSDSRWAAVSTLRGTTHIFPISPYGGACGVRTHTQPRVVNRLSRFHRSAGLPIATTTSRAGSPVGDGIASGAWFPNPRLPPHPPPGTVPPLAQIRPTATLPTHTITRTSAGRQRLSSLSEDSNPAPLLARARFGPPPAGAAGAGGRTAQLSLYLLPASGCLLHAALHPRPARSVPKEKICDESPIELDVEPLAQWPLQRPAAAADLPAPLPPASPLLLPAATPRYQSACVSEEERWLSQVEIVTHAGPHRRLWMGPQFVFKTYNCTGSNSSLSEAEAVEVEATRPGSMPGSLPGSMPGSLPGSMPGSLPGSMPGSVPGSTPVNMPGARPLVPVLIDSGSASSLEHSPSDSFRRKCALAESGRAASVCDVQLREDLAEAMREDHGWTLDPGTRAAAAAAAAHATVERAVDQLGTVVVPPRAAPPPHEDADLYTHSNDDEARFRPVVAAPAPLAPPLLARPLPRHTRIPAQAAAPAPRDHPAPHTPHPLTEDVVIPAALTHHTLDNSHLATKDLVVTDEPRQQSLPKSRPDGIQPAARVRESPTPQLNSDDSVSERPDQSDDVITVQPLKSASVFPEGVVSVKDKPKGEAKAVVDEKKDNYKSVKDSRKSNNEKDDNKEVKLRNKEVVDTTKTSDKKDRKMNESYEREIQSSKDKDIKMVPKVTEIITDNTAKSNDKLKCIKEKEVVHTDNKGSKKDRDESNYLEDKTNDVYKEFKASKDLKTALETKPSVLEKKPKEHKYHESGDVVKESKYLSEEFKVFGTCEYPIGPKTYKSNEDKLIKKDTSAISEKKQKDDRKTVEKNKQDIVEVTKPIEKNYEPLASITLKLNSKIEANKKRSNNVEIKTEEQAWDMLLNETEKAATPSVIPPQVPEKVDEPKTKSKKNRKHKKSVDETAAKDDDSFVEIHAIEQPANTGDLVSISTSCDDAKYARQTYKAKARSAKSVTPERNMNWGCDLTFSTPTKVTKPENDDSEISVETSPSKQAEFFEDSFHTLHVHMSGVASETTSFLSKDMPARTKKSKSLSPYLDSHRKRSSQVDRKDLIIIDSTTEDFPDIKLTSASKNRKKSPQITEPKVEVADQAPVPAVRSWSSIASSKSKISSDGKVDDIEKQIEQIEVEAFEEEKSKPWISLHDKLVEICKRTDIMVAECDAPTDLSFVEEHHSLRDLPPLEPLDFALDNFRLEVMRDSLLENNEADITSPICKINIDDILSSIKDTSRVLETSTFNLVDMEKVPKKKERGFSVIENERISTQEVDVVEGVIEKEDMEKSSEDDTTPVVSTDSDDKKSAEAAAALPAKQTAKAKKSRRKKK